VNAQVLPGPHSAAVVRETHSAVVLLVADRAYKVKKPVDLGFLDFRSLAVRERVSRRELELNSRLAPDVYLDVATLAGSDGVPTDYVLVMRRMPEAARLSTLVTAGQPVDDHLSLLARLLAAFHARADRGPAIAAEGDHPALLRRWTANLAETEQYVGAVLPPEGHAELSRLVHRYLAGRRVLLAERAAEGLVVDGHGDLIADDVFCLPDGPRVLDCLEFDDRLRWVDVLDDVAFLAMDLESLGRPDLGARFVASYHELGGARAVPSLEHHYIAYRAFVRAKVACIRAAQGDPTAAADARAHLDLALRHARASDVSLILVGGAPGSGKTTLAGGLADRLDAMLLSTDLVRRELGTPPSERYGPAAKAAAYAELLRRAGLALARGEHVVLDATWGSAALREQARELAERTSSRLVALECHVRPDLAAARAQARLAAGEGPSEAGAVVSRALAGERDPWLDATRVDTTGDPATSLARAMDLLPAF
jgi:aminoglycoside phosphotransferase family enzyme/predicted kinase